MRQSSAKRGVQRSDLGMNGGWASKLDDLAVFVAVAQRASFVAAARRTGRATSSVSRAVARLEDQLGVRLLRRTSRRVALTGEGRQLLAEAAPGVDGLVEALAAAGDHASEPTGVVRVTAPAYTGVARIAPALAAFARRYAKVDVELETSNAMRDLVEDGFDFGVRVGPVADASFVARPLWRGRFALYATRALVRATRGRGALTQAELEAAPCVVMRSSPTWRFRAAGGRPVAVTPRARFTISDPRAAVEIARQGLGFALLPRDAAAGVAELEPVACALGEPEPVELFVVYPSRRLLPRRVRLAIEWLLDERTTPRPG
jgi:LysR family transcriptional regulator, transcriptional activator AphB